AAYRRIARPRRDRDNSALRSPRKRSCSTGQRGNRVAHCRGSRSTANEACLMRTMSPEALSHLVDSLRKLRAEYAITESPIKQRTCWINELECVLRTLIQVPEISNEGLLIPLGHLYNNLIDLNFGTADPGLQPHRPAHRHLNPRSARF